MTKQISRKITTLFLVLMIGLTPALSYANDKENKQDRGNDRQGENHDDDDDQDDDKGNDKNKSERKEDKLERKEIKNENKTCRKAFKNLFRSGNLGRNSADFYIECLKPFGFETKFIGQASSTPDTTSPIITDLSITPATTTANITWHTDEKSDSTVFWSTSANINIASPSTASTTKNQKTKNHRVVLGNLASSTTYFVIVRSKDTSSNMSNSSETSFQTKTLIVVVDNVAPFVTDILVTEVSTSTLKVAWNTNEPATSRIYYGTSTVDATNELDLNAISTSFIENLTLKLNHLISIVSLLPQTIYHIVIRSIDGSGNATTTASFATTTTLN